MKQEERNLLLADLSGRVPYGVEVQVTVNETIYDARVEAVFADGTVYVENGRSVDAVDISEVKPYLQSLSELTEKQYEEILQLTRNSVSVSSDYFYDWHNCSKLSVDDVMTVIDYLNRNGIDYRDLFSKNLAIERPNSELIVHSSY